VGTVRAAQAIVSVPRPSIPSRRPAAIPFPMLAWQVWLPPAAVLVALSFPHLLGVFTAYRCLAREQALRQATSRESRLVATLRARVSEAEREVLQALDPSRMAPVAQRALKITSPPAPAALASDATFPCRAWPPAQRRCVPSASPPANSIPLLADAGH